MPNNTQSDIRTKAYVLRRTNFGEADRILNLITPQGKISAIARGVRKEKSRLAGGIEIFSLTDVNIHKGKGELFVVTSAKMLKYHGNIVADLQKMELAALFLKKVSLAAENSDNPEYFKIVDSVLGALDENEPRDVVEAWFWFNLTKASGEQVNLYRDGDGEKLDAETRYVWNVQEEALVVAPNGDIGADEIKIMRLMIAAELEVVLRIKMLNEKILPILKIARALGKC